MTGVIRINNPRWLQLLKFLSGIFDFEITEHNQAKGRYEGAAEFFTQEQAKEIAKIADYKQGYMQIHKAMWKAGLNSWRVIADRLNKNGQGFLTLTEIKNIGRATATEIFCFGFKNGLLWFEN